MPNGSCCSTTAFGPFTTIEPLLEKFQASAADVWAVTDTVQFEYHLQSYVLGFTGKSLREAPLHAFWRDVVEASKDDVIWRYESDSVACSDASGMAWTWPSHGSTWFPRAGIPRSSAGRVSWIAVSVRQTRAPDGPQYRADGEMVPIELRRRFAIDVAEWV